MSGSSPSPAQLSASQTPAGRLLAILRQTYSDVHRRPPRDDIALDSSLDRDLGLDSLARVELLLRVERAFGAQLPDAALSAVENGRDLLALLGKARPAGAAPPVAPAAIADLEPGVQAPAALRTLVEVLDWHAAQHPERIHIRYLEEAAGDLKEQAISCGALRQAAESLASGLQALGLAPRETVAIMLPTGPDYFAAYFGILIAGGVPVPIYPPYRLAQIEEHLRRQSGILANAQTRILITLPAAQAFARLLRASVPELQHIASPEQLRQRGERLIRVPLTTRDIAFIQYTSGSTGHPKGVVLTHANLLANIRAFGRAVEFGPEDVVVSWLPLYHDMGLIAAWLGALNHGIPLVVMSPVSFLTRPERWLWAIHRYRGTLTAAPNFAFELCLKRIEDAQIEGLDLSSLRFAANGSEQVRPETLKRFQQRFAPYGLRPAVVLPVYGLAEATVGLAAPRLAWPPRIDRVARAPFMREHRVVEAGADDANPLVFACCGKPLPGHDLRVVDASGAVLPERVEGRLEFRGPSATRGYYRNPAQTRRLFHDGWADTGDRAYLADGEVFITGRVKDIIIRGGRNLYPDEIEQAVSALPGVRRGCVCAVGVPDRQTGTERLLVLAETRETDRQRREQLVQAIQRSVGELIGEPADEIVLAPPGAVLKTSSGKIRREATRSRLEQGGGPPAAARWQALRIVLPALRPELQRLLRRAAGFAYGAWVWTWLALLVAPAWLVTALSPTPAVAWAFNRALAGLVLRLAGIRLRVRGRAQLRTARPHVLVANHGSYLDGLVLLAALPGRYSFVAKRELRDRPIARIFLQRLGVEFVERFSIRQSVQDSARLAGLARQGRHLAFFPEGTFVASPGLLPFHLGAFTTAISAGVDLVPVGIRGARDILRGNERLPRRGRVTVSIGSPLRASAPDGDAFRSALELRDGARAYILAHCGEPDLAQTAA